MPLELGKHRCLHIVIGVDPLFIISRGSEASAALMIVNGTLVLHSAYIARCSRNTEGSVNASPATKEVQDIKLLVRDRRYPQNCYIYYPQTLDILLRNAPAMQCPLKRTRSLKPAPYTYSNRSCRAPESRKPILQDHCNLLKGSWDLVYKYMAIYRKNLIIASYIG